MHDVTGIGLGPSNLSLAALFVEAKHEDFVFFSKDERFTWHDGMLLPGARMQTHYLKDLVTPVCPTSRFSFVNYLAETGRLYRFLNLGVETVSRAEYKNYYRWVSGQLPNLRFGSRVEVVELRGGRLYVHVNGQAHPTRNVVLGVGTRPSLPAFLPRSALGRHVFHSSRYASERQACAGRRVAVVGGGQSAAEIVADLLSQSGPVDVQWINRKPRIYPLEDNPFSNEFFGPRYGRAFRSCERDHRRATVAEQDDLSNGVTRPLISAIYELASVRELMDGPAFRLNVFNETELVGLTEAERGHELRLRSGSGTTRTLAADKVILATGYESAAPDIEFRGFEMPSLDAVALRADHSLELGELHDGRIYVQNLSPQAAGIAERNLSLAAVRAAHIANSVLGRDVYPVRDEDTFSTWPDVTGWGR